MEYVYYIEVRDADTCKVCYNMGVAYFDLKMARQFCDDWNDYFKKRNQPLIAVVGSLYVKNTPITF